MHHPRACLGKNDGPPEGPPPLHSRVRKMAQERLRRSKHVSLRFGGSSHRFLGWEGYFAPWRRRTKGSACGNRH
eukprot:14387195-Alexandrium_andersonii.AAC.1